MGKLLTEGVGNYKISKSDKKGAGYLTAIMHLLPHRLSGHQVCPASSEGCRSTCLNFSGRGQMTTTQKARLRRTLFFFQDREGFKKQLYKEIESFVRKCDRLSQKPAVRLNGTSDIVWERIFPDMFDIFKQVQFYEYCKDIRRVRKNWAAPSNCHFTFSRSEENEHHMKEVIDNKLANVAVVFRKNIPRRWNNKWVINMVDSDLRFLDPGPGRIGGLVATGLAKKDTTGFVVDV